MNFSVELCSCNLHNIHKKIHRKKKKKDFQLLNCPLKLNMKTNLKRKIHHSSSTVTTRVNHQSNSESTLKI